MGYCTSAGVRAVVWREVGGGGIVPPEPLWGAVVYCKPAFHCEVLNNYEFVCARKYYM